LTAVEQLYRPLTHVPESSCDDTLTREWPGWLALATFEYPSRLPSARYPIETLAQCSAFAQTIMAELDVRLGWRWAPRGGALATAEWAAQQRCLAILLLKPTSPTIPVAELVAAGDETCRAVMASAPELAAATGWQLPI
jgi:hypothetical protein